MTAGLGREPNTWLRLWSPEGGVRALTGPDGVAASPPADSTSGIVYFVQTSGNVAHLAAIEPRSGEVRRLTSDPAYAEEAARVSDDGRDVLVLRRRIADGQLELWRLATDGRMAGAVVRFAPPLSAVDRSRFGSWPPPYWFDQLAWSR